MMSKRQIFDDVCSLLSQVTSQEDAPLQEKTYVAWGSDHWENVIEMASENFVLPAIASRLRGDRSLQAINPTLQEFFEEIHAGNSARNRQILAEIEKMALLANQWGIEPILLKGSAHLVNRTYDDAGARYQSDIDILVDESEREILARKLMELGYRHDELERNFAEFYHAAPLYAEGSDIAIEIHSDTGAYRFGLRPGGRRLGLDYAGISARASTKVCGEARLRVPCLENLLTHTLSHNQLGHGQRFNGFLEMRDVLDLHFLTLNGEEPDAAWAGAMATVDQAGYGALIRGFLRALRTSVPGTALPGGRDGMAERFHSWRYRLRRGQGTEGDVSISLLATVALFLYLPNWFLLLHFVTGRRFQERHWRALRNLLGLGAKEAA